MDELIIVICNNMELDIVACMQMLLENPIQILHCNIICNPQPLIMWYINSLHLNMLPLRYVILK